jgi:hypothetical protein
MVRDFPGMVSPSERLGVRRVLRREMPWLSAESIEDAALEFDLHAWDLLRWADMRSKETDEYQEPVPKRASKTRTVRVPRHTTVEQVLMLDEDDDERPTLSPSEVREKAEELRNDPDALREFLRPRE